MIAELQSTAPLFYRVMYSLASSNDYRTLVKVGTVHFPGICSAVVILLKERNLAHQVLWNRFVNVRGGPGKNIPCDLHNEHVNKQLKYIIQNMGPNLIEKALQRAARSVSTLQTICERFDRESAVPHTASAHSTKPDIDDVKKVVVTMLKNKLLVRTTKREHKSFPKISLNPLQNWNLENTKEWIEEKKIEYIKYKGSLRRELSERVIDINSSVHYLSSFYSVNVFNVFSVNRVLTPPWLFQSMY